MVSYRPSPGEALLRFFKMHICDQIAVSIKYSIPSLCVEFIYAYNFSQKANIQQIRVMWLELNELPPECMPIESELTYKAGA